MNFILFFLFYNDLFVNYDEYCMSYVFFTFFIYVELEC